MSDSESESVEVPLFAEREEWADVKPIPLPETENPVVKIDYTPEFVDAHNYLRAVMASGEKSERVLELTGVAIKCNPANYTAWQYRRETIFAIGSSVEKELDEVAEQLSYFPKNFQIWHHRRELLTKLDSPGAELTVIEVVLSNDAKNYHAWAHRKWVVCHFDIVNDNEEKYAMSLIESDVRNNSAWNYLNFVVERRDLKIGTADEATVTEQQHLDIRQREIDRSLDKMRLAPGNESVHNYLIGNLVLTGPYAKSLLVKSAPQAVTKLLSLDSETCSWVKASLVDIYLSADEHKLPPSDLPDLCEGKTRPFRERVTDLCTVLSKIDPVRCKYWKHMMTS